MSHLWVTIGTPEYWAPPQRVLIEVDEHLVIATAEQIEWVIQGHGVITRWAFRARDGWRERPLQGVRVVAGQAAIIKRGQLSITSNFDDEPIDMATPALPAPARQISRRLPLIGRSRS